MNREEWRIVSKLNMEFSMVYPEQRKGSNLSHRALTILDILENI